MIPLIQREVVERRKWIPEADFLDMLALAQSAPGVIAVNTAIFIGYKIKGIKGSLVTVLGSALPSFLIILAIATFFTQLRGNAVVESVFKGIRPAVVALIVAPLWKMGKSAKITWKTLIFPVAAALLVWLVGLSPVIVIAVAIVGGIVVRAIQWKKGVKR